ncbi:hypothetical protein tinsulaeT_25530 [Thalassotalea insulae]|uniref:Terminase n=1 Tax=Thalassotalea insulae TaxID=2056778 RepID=A0ABQ6GTF6_9GAMM|nr:Mpo1-like protein [Thalassotalea insulae]GLX79213.1 hypothetical protein tinsulaeT_25530 [Thalassotalea insulae]
MPIKEIASWQWNGYAKFHQSRINLLIHIVAVPIFIFAVIIFLLALVKWDLLSLVIAAMLIGLSIGVQGIGHNKEQLPVEPFTGAKNAVTRIILEQLYTFPKFVLTGGWYAAYRNN